MPKDELCGRRRRRLVDGDELSSRTESAAVELKLCLHFAVFRPGHLRGDVDAGIIAHLRQLIRRDTIGRGNKEIDGSKLGTGENSRDRRGIRVKK